VPKIETGELHLEITYVRLRHEADNWMRRYAIRHGLQRPTARELHDAFLEVFEHMADEEDIEIDGEDPVVLACAQDAARWAAARCQRGPRALDGMPSAVEVARAP
jgi:hypothetical protein